MVDTERERLSRLVRALHCDHATQSIDFSKRIIGTKSREIKAVYLHTIWSVMQCIRPNESGRDANKRFAPKQRNREAKESEYQ